MLIMFANWTLPLDFINDVADNFYNIFLIELICYSNEMRMPDMFDMSDISNIYTKLSKTQF